MGSIPSKSIGIVSLEVLSSSYFFLGFLEDLNVALLLLREVVGDAGLSSMSKSRSGLYE